MWEEDRERTSGYVAMLAAFACHVALFLSLQAVLFADIAVSLWLGPEFDDAASVVRVTVSPAALFVVYIMLRATLDAVAVKSYNSRNNLIALRRAGRGGGRDARPRRRAPGDVRGLGVRRWSGDAGHPHLPHRAPSVRTEGGGYDLALALPLAALTAALGLAARPLIDDSSAALVLLLVLELALAAIFFGVLFWRRAPWTQMLGEPALPAPVTDSVSDIGKSPPIIAFCKDWDDDPTSNHHVLAELAKTRTVVWINSLGMRRPSLVSRSDRRRLLRKVRELVGRLRNVGDRLWVVTPVVVPFPDSALAQRLNALLLGLALRIAAAAAADRGLSAVDLPAERGATTSAASANRSRSTTASTSSRSSRDSIPSAPSRPSAGCSRRSTACSR